MDFVRSANSRFGRKNVAEKSDFAQIAAATIGGRRTQKSARNGIRPFINIPANIAAKRVRPTVTRTGNTAATIAISKQDFGEKKMEFKKLPIDSLVPASYNPRKKLKPGDSEFEKIKNSIAEFGYVDPVIVNRDLTVIGGHQRITVLKDRETPSFPPESDFPSVVVESACALRGPISARVLGPAPG